MIRLALVLLLLPGVAQARALDCVLTDDTGAELYAVTVSEADGLLGLSLETREGVPLDMDHASGEIEPGQPEVVIFAPVRNPADGIGTTVIWQIDWTAPRVRAVDMSGRDPAWPLLGTDFSCEARP